MSLPAKLQVGGTLNPRKHVYVERSEDAQVYNLLREGEYVNILSSRQMGKSSLVMRTMRRLQEQDGNTDSVRTVYVDLAAKLGKITDHNIYYQGLLTTISEGLGLAIDVEAFWVKRVAESPNQRLMRFFRDVVAGEISQPVVIFLDEIDSSLSLPFTDDLFTAIRGMYNERPLVESYERITFCLIGVATPNELIKDRRTTPYNVGFTIELRDFDPAQEDLSPFAEAIGGDPAVGQTLLERTLYWTGGHPYLTAKLCAELSQAGAGSTRAVDEHVEQAFRSLDRVTSDVHFQQVLRFLDTRLSDALATFDLYARLLEGARERDQTTLAYLELKLSGLVKRDAEGYLVIRNRIYRRLFDDRWAEGKRRRSELAAPEVQRSRRLGRIALMVSVVVAVVLTWWFADASNRAKVGYALGLYPLVEPSMQKIPAGRFQMGDLSGSGFSRERPVHSVRFEKPFEIGVYEVSFEEYDQFALVTGRRLPDDEGWGRGTRPVINVSWNEAQAYAEWLSAQTGKSYRLPTEAEWEYAARAGTKTPRFWDENAEQEVDPACRYANVLDRNSKSRVVDTYRLGDVLGSVDPFDCDDSFAFTAPVGQFAPNAWGLHDMLGNVWEWVQDCYVVNYENAPEDGSARESDSCARRVLRGGSLLNEPRYVRSANRLNVWPEYRDFDVGFRLARTF